MHCAGKGCKNVHCAGKGCKICIVLVKGRFIINVIKIGVVPP